jgi:acetolactate synthase-1/2/3 large subunit
MALADRVQPKQVWELFHATLQEREDARDAEIAGKCRPSGELVDPVHLFLRMEEKLSDDAILIVDGGDFVATGAYILRPRKPLSWLDPGVFGTLGVGGGFAVGAASVRPDAEIWLLYGDGSSAYSLAEFDTYVRHGYAPIAVIGTDASWNQIARDQKTILGDLVGTELLRTAYHTVAEGYGGKGLLLDDPEKVDEVLDEARRLSAAGTPVCINVLLKTSDFREGSISI